tara:strand:+ start:1253 stop:2074 length:822 start_codon:yes stop_codon:yes gene_type:complete
MSKPTLKKGSKGDDVVYLQKCLNKHGHLVTEDGDFGNKTHDAVRQFQAANDLTIDGIVGNLTWMRLEASSPTRVEEIGSTSDLDEQQKWVMAQIPSGTLTACRKVIEIAVRDLGADEIPDGSNWGGEIHHLVNGYNEYWGIKDEKHYPWCAMACSSWIGISLGLGNHSRVIQWERHPFGKFLGGAAQIEDWGKDKGVWISAQNTAPTGACFTMARGGSGSDPSGSARAGHVGLVVCDNGDGTITTMEGNVSNGVRCKIRQKTDLHGYVCWWRA